MRKNNKYTYFEKDYFGLRVPTRILKFKRPKWIRVQNFISKKISGKRFLKRPSKRLKYLSNKFHRVLHFSNNKKFQYRKAIKYVFKYTKKPKFTFKKIYRFKHKIRYKNRYKIRIRFKRLQKYKYLTKAKIKKRFFDLRKHVGRFTLSYKFKYRRFWMYLSSLNPFRFYIETARQSNLKHLSREKSKFRRSLVNLYGIKIASKFKNKDKLTLLSDIWYKPYYLPYQLLWNTSLVSSIEEARKKAESKEILLNDASLKGNFLLRYGDVLTLKNLSYNFKSVRKKYYIRKLNFKTIILDYYSQEIFITKDFSKIGEEIIFNATPRIVDMKFLNL